MKRIYVKNEDYERASRIIEKLGFEPRCELFPVDGEWLLSLNLRQILGDGDSDLVRELRKFVRVRTI